MVRLIGERDPRKAEPRKRVHHAHQNQPQGSSQGGSFLGAQEALGVRASRVCGARTGHGVVEVYVERVEFPLLLVKQVFKNEDGTEGVLYLVSSDVTLEYERLTTIYQRRWKVEEYHESLKSNASLAKSPTKTIRTQSNHVFASIYAFVKLERVKMATKLNHFALRSRMYLKAVRAAFGELQTLRVPGAEPG